MALCRTGLGNFQQNRFQQKNADLLKLWGLWNRMGFDKLSMNYGSNCQTRGWEPGGSSSRSEACVWIWGHESGNSYTVGRFWLSDPLCQGSLSVQSALGHRVTGLQGSLATSYWSCKPWGAFRCARNVWPLLSEKACEHTPCRCNSHMTDASLRWLINAISISKASSESQYSVIKELLLLITGFSTSRDTGRDR